MTTNAISRAAAYRERADQMRRKADTMPAEELRQAYLILARDWDRMAEGMTLKALEESPPLAPR